jgi:hypothetical protein
MALRVSVGNVNKRVIGVWVSVGGAWKKVTNAWSSNGNVYRLWWRLTRILTGTSLFASDIGGNNSFASVSITYQTNGTVTRNAQTGGGGSSSPGAPVPNWNTYGGAYVSWDRLTWNQSNACFPDGTAPEGARMLMNVPFTVGVSANYNSADPPGQDGNGVIRMTVWADLTSPTPIATQDFNFSVQAG